MLMLFSFYVFVNTKKRNRYLMLESDGLLAKVRDEKLDLSARLDKILVNVHGEFINRECREILRVDLRNHVFRRYHPTGR